MPMRSNFALRLKFLTCSLCNEFIELETTNVDEIGNPVHEECHVQKVCLKKPIRPPPGALDARCNNNPLSQSIVRFLNSAEAHPITNSCPVCGSQLEHRKFTFFYAGQTWEIQLAICLDCDPISPVPPHDA
jgi:hypothetical protein